MKITDFLKENLLKTIIVIIVITLLLITYYLTKEDTKKEATTFSNQKVETSNKEKEMTFENILEQERKLFLGTQETPKEVTQTKTFDFGNEKKVYQSKDSLALIKLQNKLIEIENQKTTSSKTQLLNKVAVKVKEPIKEKPIVKELTFEEKLILSRQGSSTLNQKTTSSKTQLTNNVVVKFKESIKEKPIVKELTFEEKLILSRQGSSTLNNIKNTKTSRILGGN